MYHKRRFLIQNSTIKKVIPMVLSTAYRRLVGTSIAAVPEEASGILSGDAVEGGSKRLLQGLEGVRGDPPQMGFHLGPSGFNRAEVRAVGRQIAIGKA